MTTTNSNLILLGLRAPALALVVCTTGVMSLGATTTGFVRTAGSFVDDGFLRGMEITPAGFPVNTRRIITDVSALTLTISGPMTAYDAAEGRSLSVGIPGVQQWDDGEPEENGARLEEPIVGRPWIREQFIPIASKLLQTKPRGLVAERGAYKLTWYGLSRQRDYTLNRCIDALKACYQPGSQFALSDGHVLAIRGDVAPQRGEILPHTGGWNRCVLEVHWLIHTRNS